LATTYFSCGLQTTFTLEDQCHMHLSSGIALDLIEGRLGQEKEAFWKDHLENCRVCTQTVNSWQELVADLTSCRLRSAPDADLCEVLQIFDRVARRLETTVAL
jgi:hypothetical protein